MVSNPVLILTHNCLDLTKRCVESVRNQDISTDIFVVDNDSTDHTRSWLYEERIPYVDFRPQIGVSAGWNFGLTKIFNANLPRYEYALVLNNDTYLEKSLYRHLLSYEVPFVTGVSVGSMEELALPFVRKELAPCPDFSAWLIRREAWERVGPFNDAMRFYASDNDWHVRAHRAGLTLWNAGVPFYHERSSTLKNAPVKERRQIELQADADREVFKEIYGVYPWEPGYADLFKEVPK